LTEKHEELVNKALRRLDIGEDRTFIKIADSPPLPDALVIDWERHKVYAIEAETHGDGRNKFNLYTRCDKTYKGFDYLCIQTSTDFRRVNLHNLVVKVFANR
jgi:hypothetical protein